MDSIFYGTKGVSPMPKSIPFTIMLLAAVAVLVAFIGCSKPEPTPVVYMGPTLTCADLGVADVSGYQTEFLLLDKEPSVGRFPTGLAVARLRPPGAFFVPVTENAQCRNWRIDNIPINESVWWNKLFNTVHDIREVTVFDDRVIQAPDDDRSAIIQAAKRLKAGLCLIYGYSPAPDDQSASLAGVIVETATEKPLAYVRATAGPEDFEPPRLDRLKEDLRIKDANYLVARKFEQQVFRGIIGMIEKDQPPTSTQPSPWKDHTTIPPELPPIYIVPNQPIGR